MGGGAVGRVMWIMALAILLLTVVLGGSVLADTPPGAGCKGIEKAVKVIEKGNPTEEDSAHSNIFAKGKAHECKV